MCAGVQAWHAFVACMPGTHAWRTGLPNTAWTAQPFTYEMMHYTYLGQNSYNEL